MIWCQRQNLTILQISYQYILKILTNYGNPSTLCFNGTSLKYCLIPPHWIHCAICFQKYFTDKIANIRSRFVIKDVDCHVTEQPFIGNTMHCFTPTTTSEVRTITLKCPNKYCDLDPFPTFLLKRCIDQMIHPITTIINMLMQGGVVSDDFMQVLVNRFITKIKSWKHELKDYRPISNLIFVEGFVKVETTFISTFHKFANHVSIICVISVESGVIYLCLLLKPYQLLWLIVDWTIVIPF